MHLITLNDTHTHTHTHTHNWTRDRTAAEASTCRRHKRFTSVPPAEFKPGNPASERPQTCALDRAATGITTKSQSHTNFLSTSLSSVCTTYHFASFRDVSSWLRSTHERSIHSFFQKATGNEIYEGWNFNSGNYLFTADTKYIQVSKFYCPSV